MVKSGSIRQRVVIGGGQRQERGRDQAQDRGMSPEKFGQTTGGGEEVASVLRHKKVMSSKRELWLFRVPDNFDASSLRFVSSPSHRLLIISPSVTLATNKDRARENQTPKRTKHALFSLSSKHEVDLILCFARSRCATRIKNLKLNP